MHYRGRRSFARRKIAGADRWSASPMNKVNSDIMPWLMSRPIPRLNRPAINIGVSRYEYHLSAAISQVKLFDRKARFIFRETDREKIFGINRSWGIDLEFRRCPAVRKEYQDLRIIAARFHAVNGICKIPLKWYELQFTYVQYIYLKCYVHDPLSVTKYVRVTP